MLLAGPISDNVIVRLKGEPKPREEDPLRDST